MSALAQLQNSYLDATRSTGSPRDVEYQLFSRVTGKLNHANVEGAEYVLLVEALHDNLTLWQALALDVMSPENTLPEKLRAQLFYLFEFTRAQTPKVLRREADAKSLIDINTSIMRGLRPSDTNRGKS
jgi:flagellar protein FlaF